MLPFDDSQNNRGTRTATGSRLLSARLITYIRFYILFTEPGTKWIAKLEEGRCRQISAGFIHSIIEIFRIASVWNGDART